MISKVNKIVTLCLTGLISYRYAVARRSAVRSSGEVPLIPVNHIVFMVQENRSTRYILSRLPAYWQANGFPARSA